MKQQNLTEQQEKILQEIHDLVIIGQQKLKEFTEESTQMEEKWQKIAETQKVKINQKD